MMRALADLDRVDAGKAPRRELRPEVRSATERWVHGNTAKLASTYAVGPPPPPPRRRRRWWIALLVVLVLIAAILLIPWSRHAAGRVWKDATASPVRVLPAVKVTTHGPHAFENYGADHQPVTYNPCQAIRYTINVDLAPPGSAGLVGAAVAEISRLTGLRFIYIGVSHVPVHFTKQIDRSVLLGQHPPVEIAWASAREFTALKGDVLGFGGSTLVRSSTNASAYVTGSVALRADQLGQALRSPGGAAFVKAVILHELGHVVGLAHVNDPRELMNPSTSAQRDFGPGDRAGLARLGQGSCDTGL